MTTPAPRPGLPRLPFVLLGLMTVFTFGGPVGIGYVLWGGASPAWPPDRPVEWVTLLGVSGLVLALMLACLSLSLANRKARKPANPPGESGRPGAGP